MAGYKYLPTLHEQGSCAVVQCVIASNVHSFSDIFVFCCLAFCIILTVGLQCSLLLCGPALFPHFYMKLKNLDSKDKVGLQDTSCSSMKAFVTFITVLSEDSHSFLSCFVQFLNFRKQNWCS